MQLPFIFCTSRHLFPAVVHTYCVNSSNFLSQSDAMPDFVLLFLFQFLSIQQSLHLLFLLFHIHRHAFLCSILTGVDIRPASCFRSDNPVCIYRHHIGVRAGIRRLIAGRYRRIYSCTFPRMKCNRRLLKCNLWRSDRHFTIFADSIYGYSNDCRSMFDRGYFSCFIHSRHTFLLVFHTGVVFDVEDTLSLYFSRLYNEILDGIRRTVGLFTVTLQFTDVPSTFAVTVVVPGFFAVTFPFSLTDAMLVFADFHVTLCPVDEAAVSTALSPFSNIRLVLFKVTFVFVTVTLQLASAFFVFAVIVALPAFLR